MFLYSVDGAVRVFMSRWNSFYSIFVKICTVLDTSYRIDNRELSKVTEHRDLGILFTENLSWYSHYEPIVAKAYKSLSLLKRIFKHTYYVTSG